ncbi:MAG: DJ-1/PfpI/YhbO family deglycase/protease [Desertifilum sp. SIO1I2]|nr:DJ-1/PfpI/YhbO family deglycase/protease [Desertifilum sp. SIO1I2]
MVSNHQTQTKRVAILIENGVEDAEFQIPYKALQLAKADIVILGSRTNETYKGKQGKVSIEADATTTETLPDAFDAVIIPGGMAPDTMRTNPNTVRFVREAFNQGKLIAAVCHGPQVLIEADLLKDKNATGFIAIRKDMINAGANYIDEPLVVDGNLITSRQPGDLAIFTTAILSRLGLGGKEAALPMENDASAEWWKLADAWGGSTKGEIVTALNTALGGEKYSHEAFEQYAQKISNPQTRSLFNEIAAAKAKHIQLIETRLSALNEKPSIPTAAAEPFAKLSSWLQSSKDVDVLRRALGDLQTGIVDIFNLRKQFTDPVTTALFTQIQTNLESFEQHLAQLVRSSVNLDRTANPVGKTTPNPTTGAVAG